MPFHRRELPRGIASLLALALALLAASPVPGHAARHVVIVSLDGLRPDVALRADMPALRSLMARGSYTMFAATTDVAVTLPSHTSMLTGVPPEKHGITYNGDPGVGDRAEPAWPTLFEIAHRAGLTTALAAGKSKFSVLAKPGTLDGVFVPERGKAAVDSVVADAAVSWIMTRRPRVLVVHLPGLDRSGHDNGWGSPAQIQDAAAVDRALGRVLDAIAGAGLTDSTLVLLSADHGGAGRTHGGTDARNHFIPWIAAGPGVRADYDLTRETSLWVRTEDTFATACAWLGLKVVKPVDGRPVKEIFAGPQPAR